MFDYWTFTIFGAGFSCFVSFFIKGLDSYESRFCFPTTPIQRIGLGCSHSARRYFGNRFCFIFLQLLRCFNSLRFLYFTYEFSKEFYEVALFENLRIDACCQLPEAYRRYLRPSSSLNA